jgi:crossover junction endodeoxyribonuclease RuvC
MTQKRHSSDEHPSRPRSRILGIDPGSRYTGYGIVDIVGRDLKIVTHGTLILQREELAPGKHSKEESTPFEVRLFRLYQRLSEVITEFKPTQLAIEKVFFAKNPVSALKLGQARGAALVCAVNHGLQVQEYASTEVKSAIVGHGRADKDQVAKMLERILGPQNFQTSDASDALALAVCHAQLTRSLVQGRASHQARHALEDALQTANEKLKGAKNGTRRPKKTTRLAESLGIREQDVVGKKRIRL